MLTRWIADDLFLKRFFCDQLIIAGVDPGFGQGGLQLLRSKVADIVEQSFMSKVNYMWLEFRTCLRALEAFGFLMLKYAFSHILETLFLSF